MTIHLTNIYCRMSFKKLIEENKNRMSFKNEKWGQHQRAKKVEKSSHFCLKQNKVKRHLLLLHKHCFQFPTLKTLSSCNKILSRKFSVMKSNVL